MILRLLRARLKAGAISELFRELRERVVPRAARLEGSVAFTYGFRQLGDSIEFLTLSVWQDFDSIVRAGGGVGWPVPGTASEDLLTDLRVEHYELVEEPPRGVIAIDGPVIGLVAGTILPNAEATVHAMIRAVEEEVAAAGVVGLHVGRRLTESGIELAVLAVWRDRASLHTFAQRREVRVIDPRFSANMSDLRFETFDCLSPDRLLLPPEGPAVLLAGDDGRFIDASPGFQAILGVPGEMVLRRRFDELLSPLWQARASEIWARFLETGLLAGEFELVGYEGTERPVTIRGELNVRPGLIHALVFDAPGQTDSRPIEEIVEEVFGRVPEEEVA